MRRGSGGGKPAYVYELAPDAEELFPKAYEPVLRHLLSVLSQHVGPEQPEALTREVGGPMAGKFEAPANGLRVRLEAAVAVLNQVGGKAEIEERDGTCFIRSYGCPLSGIVPDHPELCSLVETLVAELTGVPVREHCDRRENPRCCFQVVPSCDPELAAHL